MTREEFLTKIAEKGYLLLDGGTGSVLRTMGMPAGVSTEKWAYEHPEVIDFSANCNCFGMPDRVREAAIRGVEQAMHYPDPQSQALREAVGVYEQVDPAQILCGNGASELLAALMRTLRPKRALLAAPGFYEYERTLEQGGARITFYQTQPEHGWQPGIEFLDLKMNH